MGNVYKRRLLSQCSSYSTTTQQRVEQTKNNNKHGINNHESVYRRRKGKKKKKDDTTHRTRIHRYRKETCKIVLCMLYYCFKDMEKSPQNNTVLQRIIIIIIYRCCFCYSAIELLYAQEIYKEKQQTHTEESRDTQGEYDNAAHD